MRGGHGAARPSRGPPALADVPSFLCCPSLRSPASACLSRQRVAPPVVGSASVVAAGAEPLLLSARLFWRQQGVTSARNHEPRFQTRRPDLRQDERLPSLAGQGKASPPPPAAFSAGCAHTSVPSSAFSFASWEVREDTAGLRGEVALQSHCRSTTRSPLQ